MTLTDLGYVGPAQSDYLYHFTSRNGGRPTGVPEEIQWMSPEQRLERILHEERLLAFPPFGADVPCVCFSECPPEHLAYLIAMRYFTPWGIVVTRSALLGLGGGDVAYVPDTVAAIFRGKGLGHWAVRTGPDSTWMHEREWRLPRSTGDVSLISVRAILVGDINWRPAPVMTGWWVHGSTGDALPGPDASLYAQPQTELPRLWRESPIWVWNPTSQEVDEHPPGTLL
ncbi:hypothetical protein [Streptomyces sp.]|uniref:hypothetical protein n=1 Tax=Streptomyces sp. TaxID=1931 RepID=UPI002F41832D